MASEAPQNRARTVYGRLIEQARLTLAWERLWPRLAPTLGVLAVFATLAWFNLFQSIPHWARLGLIGAFGIALLAALALLAGMRVPTVTDALGRIDAASGVPHRPATALGDRMAVGPADPVSRALWAAHQRDVEAKTSIIRLGPPRPGLPARDRFALRIAILLALATAFLYAGPERGQRLIAAFEPPIDAASTQSVRVDAWVTPPAYTRRAPILLSAERASGPVSVPQGSGLVVRVAGDPSAEIVPAGTFVEAHVTPSSAPPSNGAAEATVVERRLTLAGNSSVTVRRSGTEVAQIPLLDHSRQGADHLPRGTHQVGGARRDDADLQGRGRLWGDQRRGSRRATRRTLGAAVVRSSEAIAGAAAGPDAKRGGKRDARCLGAPLRRGSDGDDARGARRWRQ